MADSTLSAVRVFIRVSRLSKTSSSMLHPYCGSMIRSPWAVLSNTSRLEAISASYSSISTPGTLALNFGGNDQPRPRNVRSITYPPISTVGAPGGSTAPPPPVVSPTRAAGIPPISTVAEPLMMASAPPPSPRRAAGTPPISTVAAPGGIIGIGAPWVAVLTIMSVTRAAGNICALSTSVDLHHAALDRGGGATLYRRACPGYLCCGRSRGLETGLSLQLNVRSFDLYIF